MNLLPVNGGLLNGSRLLLVAAASAAIACSSALSAAAVRGQEALAPVSSGASFHAQPTHTHHTSAAVGGAVYAAAKANHSRAAQANMDAKVELRSFVFRGVPASAAVLCEARLVIIPASVLGSAQVAPNTAAVLADATKSHPGRSSAAGAAQVAIQAAPTVQRFVEAQALTGSGRLYAETTINGVVASYANLTTGAQLSVNTVGIVKRPATATVDGRSLVSAVATYVTKARATATGAGYAVFAEPYLFIGGLVNVSPTAQLTAAAVRVVQCAVRSAAAADFSATAVMRHGSAAAMTHSGSELSAKAVRTAAAHALAGCVASMGAQAQRGVFCLGDFSGDSTAVAVADRTAYVSVMYPGSEASLLAEPDITVREAEADVEGVSNVFCDPYVTRQAHVIAPVDSEIVADAVRVIPSQAEVQTEAGFVAEAVRVLEAESWALVPWCWLEAVPDTTVREGVAIADGYSALDAIGTIVKESSAHAGALVEISSAAVRVLAPEAQVVVGTHLATMPQAQRVLIGVASPHASAWVAAVPDTTVREASALVAVAAGGYGEALVVRMVQAGTGASSAVLANASRTVSAETHFDGRVTLAVVPIANPYSFDPESRTFYRQATTTNFVRSASITEFRRPA